jgi:GNAT superfamily N-acetyltransferase
MNIYFIGGASGSGKAAIMPHLKERLGDQVAIYDFDDIGVPEAADKKWRQEATEKWLQQLLSKNQDACLLGQMVLGEILSCPSAVQLERINFCLLDVSDFKRIERLKHRNTYAADQNMLNWSAWLRMHHQDPTWTPNVIQDECAHVMDFSRVNQLQNWHDIANVHLLDTTNSTLNDVAQQVANWVKSTKHQSSELEIVTSTPEEAEHVDNLIVEFNQQQIPFTQDPTPISANYVIKDNGRIVAGINAIIYHWKMLYIDVLYVDEAYRGKRLGSQLLQQVEAQAKQLGSKLSHLDTFDFQAKDFYLKQGYEVFGTLANCPQGHNRFYFKKEL